MKRSRFSDEQIIGILKEHQAGLSAADLCRKYGISDATFYTWRKKYGGREVSAARRVPQRTAVRQLPAAREHRGMEKRLQSEPPAHEPRRAHPAEFAIRSGKDHNMNRAYRRDKTGSRSL